MNDFNQFNYNQSMNFSYTITSADTEIRNTPVPSFLSFSFFFVLYKHRLIALVFCFLSGLREVARHWSMKYLSKMESIIQVKALRLASDEIFI